MNYQSRLDRVEEALVPKEAFYLVVVQDGDTRDHALEAYATQRELTEAEVRAGTVVFITETDARL